LAERRDLAFRDPIVITRDRMVIDGYARWELAKRNGRLLVLLKAWKQASQFSTDGDWMFASPVQLGRLPWSYPYILRVFQAAARNVQIRGVPTHTLRHSYRSWLDAVGTPIAVQQKLMRHSDIRTTMNLYGDGHG
jgi:integrase